MFLPFYIVLLLQICSTAAFPESKGPTTLTPATNTTKAPEATTITSASNDTINGNSTIQVTIYVFNIHSFLGGPWTMELGGCVSVPKPLYKKTSSIDTQGHCILLYGRENCEGQMVRIPAGGQNYVSLNSLNFDDTLASLQPCDSKNSNSTEHVKPVTKKNMGKPQSAADKPPAANDKKESPKESKQRQKRSEPTQKPCLSTPTVKKDSKVDEGKDDTTGWNPEVPDISYSDLGVKDPRKLNGSITLAHVIY